MKNFTPSHKQPALSTLLSQRKLTSKAAWHKPKDFFALHVITYMYIPRVFPFKLHVCTQCFSHQITYNILLIKQSREKFRKRSLQQPRICTHTYIFGYSIVGVLERKLRFARTHKMRSRILGFLKYFPFSM